MARAVTNLSYKPYLDRDYFDAVKKMCQVDRDSALDIIELEVERQEILLSADCQDLNEDNCPEYYQVENQITNLIRRIGEMDAEIFAK